jgi:hypothetical protein
VRVNCMYHIRRKVAECEEAREPLRQAMWDHMQAHFPHRTCQVRYLGLPGLHWKLEKRLLDHYRHAWITGVEWFPEVIESARDIIPGARTGVTPVAGPCPAVHTKRAALFHAAASEFLSIDPTQWESWQNTFSNFNTFWLDLTSTFGREVRGCCRQINRHLAQEQVAFGVTFVLGREKADDFHYLRMIEGLTGTASERRAEALRHMLEVNTGRRVDISAVITYPSPSGQRLGMALGTIARRTS